VLIERWHPVTRDMGLINAPVSRVVSEMVAWHSSLGTAYTRREIASSFADALEMLPPLSMEKRRLLLVPTNSEWTALFQSGIAGSDPTPPMSVLSKRLDTLAMRVCCSPPGAKWHSVIWEVYAPAELGGSAPLGYRRTLAAANDGGRWVFEESGPRYPFEKPGQYQLPRKRDRFTRELLVEYLRQFGLAPLADAFYDVSATRPAVLLESQRRWHHLPPEFTLEEAAAGLPWKRADAV
jgi:hypothetical protein